MKRLFSAAITNENLKIKTRFRICSILAIRSVSPDVAVDINQDNGAVVDYMPITGPKALPPVVRTIIRNAYRLFPRLGRPPEITLTDLELRRRLFLALPDDFIFCFARFSAFLFSCRISNLESACPSKRVIDALSSADTSSSLSAKPSPRLIEVITATFLRNSFPVIGSPL